MQKELFEREACIHRAYLMNCAFKFTYNTMDSEDLVQDTLARAFVYFHQYQEGTNIKAWLYRIMQNIYINDYRKKKKKLDSKDEFFRAYNDDNKPLPEPKLSKDEFLKVMEGIKADYQSVVTLYHFEQLTLEEIAGQLNCPVGTVKSRLHRGRLALKKVLEEIPEIGN